MDNNKLIGLAFLIGGIFFLWWTIKTWFRGPDISSQNIGGLLGAIGAIAGGIAFLLGKVHW